MLIGFGKQDITPRTGVEMCGYSGYLNRYGTAVRDPLFARSMAVSDDESTAVIVSCDILFPTRKLTAEVRRLVSGETGLLEDSIMVHTTHTHSGPCIEVDYAIAHDPPYMELLTRRIARSCIQAVTSMQEAELHHAEVPCEGMGTNRVYDKFSYGMAALENDFRPEKPELTDTTCHVLKAVAGGRVLGFVSYFGCHNVVGGPECTYFHGDYAGIATGMLEREHPGSIGLFLQGAEGDVNSAVCCLGNDEVLRALDIMAGRYARSVRHGLANAQPLAVDRVQAARHEISFSRTDIPLAELREMLAKEEAVIDDPAATGTDQEFRMAVMRSTALREMIERVERGDSFDDATELQAIRVGPVALFGTPFEVFQAVARDAERDATAPIPLVLSVTNDDQGYAPDHTAAADTSDYAARTVPLWKHTMPYANVHTELVKGILALDRELSQGR